MPPLPFRYAKLQLDLRKTQITKDKFQTNSKRQITNADFRFRVLNLLLGACLFFVFCDLVLRTKIGQAGAWRTDRPKGIGQ